MFWNNRNIRRKVPSDVIMAYKTFCDMLPKEEADKCALLMHTQPIDQNGTDLPVVVKELCSDYDRGMEESDVASSKISELIEEWNDSVKNVDTKS